MEQNWNAFCDVFLVMLQCFLNAFLSLILQYSECSLSLIKMLSNCSELLMLYQGSIQRKEDKYSKLRKRRSQMFIKIDVLKSFAIFTE